MNTNGVVSDIHQSVSNTQAIVTNIHRTIVATQEGIDGKNRLVSVTCTLLVPESSLTIP